MAEPMIKDPNFGEKTPDVNGQVPIAEWVGRRLLHLGNEKEYYVMGFAWLGATDEWGFLHRECGRLNAPTLCRPLSHLDGNRSNGEPRYKWLGW